MKVRMTFEFDDEARRTLRRYEGRSGLATRKDLRGWINGLVNAAWEDVDTDALMQGEAREERRMLRGRRQA